MSAWIIDLDAAGTPAPAPAQGGTPTSGYIADPVVQADIVNRFQFLIPHGWFHSALKDAVMTGAANAFSLISSLLTYIRNQTRISTATDGFLDLIAGDLFGASMPRGTQSDTKYRNSILLSIFRERGTRNAVVKVLQQLTGRTPIIFEPMRPNDTGSYGGQGLGYSCAGGYGSMLLPYQSFIQAYRPSGTGIPNIAGYGVSTGAYSTPSQAAYEDVSQVTGNVTDADIFSAINSVHPIGYVLWARISS